MTNYEKITSMSIDELNKFLWWLKIDAVSNFVSTGGLNVMNAKEQLCWLKSDNEEFLNYLISKGKENAE